ncbi:MAG: NADH:flavin oxidoreductase [Acidobacteria bacterium]|nr:MAG: NADH:flavin oxidoreductase [Acidobacteriota bacterium]PYR19488.1 MAG: NADH:flavin oxidoreductase [Acidobacteriota bacterium]PYR47018.1 MAG: NADH:flavin oxidoreductase [Acidobacteriota bacterium]
MADVRYPRLASFKTADALRRHLRQSGIALELDDALPAAERLALAQPIDVGPVRVGNRFCILPMEGWDGTSGGAPSELTRRRWRHFGISGAKLIWGGEAVAVRQDGRANPNQLLLTRDTQGEIAALRDVLVAAHRGRFGSNADGDLFIGLQLTHSGRFARPHATDRPEPLAAYAHPWLDRRFPGGLQMVPDEDLDRLVDQFVEAARLAWDAGFAFVDVKACHGYLGHELLSARDREGRYGGSLENRTRFLRSIVAGIRDASPRLAIGVRLSVFDTVPFRKNARGVGEGEAPASSYRWAFGLFDSDKGSMDEALADARQVLGILERLGVRWICVTAGSPYYNPHVQRPALFPPVDGYLPPEDPLAGVARQIDATARLKAACPSLVFVGSGYSYLQEWLPHVAERNVREGLTDFVGLGRMVLAYPDLPADVLSGVPLKRKAICRTFSDCTTGPRLGLVSGCYPLDPFYEAHPDGARLRACKAT